MSTDHEFDFFEAPSEDQVGEAFKNKVTQLVRDHRRLESEISALQAEISDLTKKRVDLEVRAIPDALAEAGLKEFVTLEGLRVTTKFVVGAIPSEKKEEAYEWLDSHGFSSIIKRGVAVKFDKGSEAMAERAAQQLRALGLDPTITTEVHPQTFMSFAREQLGKGNMIPLAQWGVFHGDKAVIK